MILKLILRLVWLANAFREQCWTGYTSEHTELIAVRGRPPLFWVKAHGYAMIYMIGIGFCGRWHFLHALYTAGACQVTGQSDSRAQTSCDAKSFCASLYHSSSSDVVDLEKAQFKDVYKATFSHVYLSGDTFLALFQDAPRVWNLNSSVSSVEPMVSYHAWLLICSISTSIDLPREGQLLIPVSPSSSHLLS